MRIPLRTAGSPPSPAEPLGRLARIPWLGKGFRPFFLLAALHVVLLLPAWLAWLLGRANPGGALRGMDWHAHEMVFGFAVAVVAGFLLTAAGNWTGRETATGGPLLALVVLWLAARAALLLPIEDPLGPALVAALFLPALAIVVGRVVLPADSRRNHGFVLLLGLLWAAELLVLLDAAGVLPGWRRRGTLLGVDLLILMILAMGGRVIPLFTRNATGVAAIRSNVGLDRACLAGMAALAALSVALPEHPATAVLALLTGLLAAARATHWGSRHTLPEPLLWVLHAGYAWVPVGLILRGASGLGAGFPPSLATHALTAGAIGTLTLGMMARVALGHTGRPLHARGPVVVAFGLVTLSAVARVLVPLALPAAYRATLLASGAIMAAAFGLFLWVYAPILVRPRVDGRPG